MTAADMVNACFRHQHPEAYGGEPVWDPTINLPVSSDPSPTPSDAHVPEELMGHPDAVPL